MKEWKGTKGWEEASIAYYMRHEDGSSAEVVPIYDNGENTVCYVSFENQTIEEGTAHIKVIKCAPELLEVLSGLMKTLPIGFDNEYKVFAKELISKCTGK